MIINKKRPAAALLLVLLLGMTSVLAGCGSNETPDDGQDYVGGQFLIVDEEGDTYISAEAAATLYSFRSYLNDADKVVVVRDEEDQQAMIFSPASALTNTGSVLVNEATGEITDGLEWSYKVFDYLVYIPVEAVEKGLGKTDWEEKIAYLSVEDVSEYYAGIVESTFETEEVFMTIENYYGSSQSRLFTSLRNYENAQYVQFEGTIDGEYVDVSCERNYMATEIREYTDLYDEDYNHYVGARIFIQGVNPSGSVVLTMADGTNGTIENMDSNGFHPYNSVSRYGFDGIKKYWNVDVQRDGETEDGYAIFRISKIGDEVVDIELHLDRSRDNIVHIIDTVEFGGKTMVRDLDIFY